MSIDPKEIRTHTCGDLRESDVGSDVVVKGWVNRRRDHGGVIFIDLRDRYGLTQVVFRPEEASEAHKKAEAIRGEFVVAAAGRVAKRPEGMVNSDLPTGTIEVVADGIEILSEAKTPPFSLEGKTEVSEEVRFKYRYLDLRRPELQRNLDIRHRMTQAIRRTLDAENFIDVETPILTKSTPEGARDYLVPSRVQPGKFYALPQSPQLFKQLLMIAGLDRYYQIVRCFRDEDLRADRQPEFTQLDLEMTFATPETIYAVGEKIMVDVFRHVLDVDIETPFPRMSYKEADERFGSDKPDFRWAIEVRDLSPLFRESEFRVFRDAIAGGGEVRGFCLPGGGELSRSQVDQLVRRAKGFGAKGLVWVREERNKNRNSSAGRFLAGRDLEKLAEELGMKEGDLALLVADEPNVARAALNGLRLHCLEKLDIKPQSLYAFAWIVDFPLFEYSEEEKRFVSRHHPFTQPHPDDLERLKKGEDLGSVRAMAYDLVLNGFEIAGGSTRIHRPEIQRLIFERLGIKTEEAQTKFGFFLEALEYGTPPHGGIAFGLDRIAMILAGTDAIRDVIAFPKTQRAIDQMTGSPSDLDAKQLEELKLRLLTPR